MQYEIHIPFSRIGNWSQINTFKNQIQRGLVSDENKLSDDYQSSTFKFFYVKSG